MKGEVFHTSTATIEFIHGPVVENHCFASEMMPKSISILLKMPV